MSAEPLLLSPSTAAPWPADWDEIVVRLLASGLSQLAERCAEGVPVRLPYPVSLQRALDRISVMCLVRGVDAPRSVVDLIRWCSRPVETWPLRLNADGFDPDTQLVVDGYPSREALEWVVDSPDVEGEYRQNTLIYKVMDICRSNDRPDVYTAFRKLLVQRPALTEQEMATELGRPELVLVANQVRQAYRTPPPEALIGKTVLVCRGCGNLLLPRGRDRACVELDCSETRETATEYPANVGMLWIGPELRTFTAAPGRAELRIWQHLRDNGLEVELWPDIDAADLGIRLAEGEVWYADIKTYSNPATLARRLISHPFIPPYGAEAAYLVIGREQIAARRGYLNELHNRIPSLKGPARSREQVVAVSESEFVAAVLRHAREVNRDA
jgi:hypothetical protein